MRECTCCHTPGAQSWGSDLTAGGVDYLSNWAGRSRLHRVTSADKARHHSTSGDCFEEGGSVRRNCQQASVAQRKDMAETEVTVSMGDMVVMKATDEDEVAAGDANKTQVILQLQPITSGNEDNAEETVTTDEVLAAGEDVELGYPITCGESKAVLLFKKFVCPGINVKCVKYEDELISPKQFVHMSGKATLKDWKRAIRMGGVMLRKMMDSGQLDFYQHSTLCTNTCRSTKFDLLINNTRFPPDSSVLSTPSSSQGQIAVGNGAEVVMIEEKSVEATSSLDWCTANVDVPKKKEVVEISEETLSFWKGIADVGLMGEVVSNIRTELLEMLRGVQLRSDQANLQDVEVAVLSNLTQVFGLLGSIKRILAVRRQMTDLGQKQVLKTLTSLEQQLEEQKKQQAQSWLVSSSSSTPPPPKRAPKRPRLHRPASATVLQPLTLHSPQYTLISPITLSSVCQPITLPGLAQPPGAVTLLTHVPQHDGKAETLTLVGTMAAQEPAQLGTMELGAVGTVSTMELGAAGTVEMANTVLVQDDESQAIEINLQMGAETEGAAKDEEERRRMDGGGEDGSGIVVGEKEMKVEMEELHLETNGQIHNLQILVVEDEEQMQVEGKSE
ncbi:glucocorticoid modulatory element-binding protein 1 isoform X2 [Neoarius graeffei]|uniref:glucocorticoid modulatory element-binding protein 1 isoform X2 n=1 Tax=Neoarius graeffei TaxID=443677 RepID=UPI00298D584F|nr:glucocorticoid modulatory element-binding protein 1 isoform X2 [Neoarius graeffei]